MILTCKGKVELLGIKEDLKEKVELARHVVSSRDPHLRTIFLDKESLAARIIQNSGCFALNFTNGNELACDRIDCFRLEGAVLECEVDHIHECGDSLCITARVVKE